MLQGRGSRRWTTFAIVLRPSQAATFADRQLVQGLAGMAGVPPGASFNGGRRETSRHAEHAALAGSGSLFE